MTAAESPIPSAVLVTNPTEAVSYIYEFIVTNDAFYASIFSPGNKYKVFSNFSLSWTVNYGSPGFGMAISPDESFLIVGSNFNSTTYLGKMNTSTGVVISSYSTVSSDAYVYIYARDSRALCIH